MAEDTAGIRDGIKRNVLLREDRKKSAQKLIGTEQEVEKS